MVASRPAVAAAAVTALAAGLLVPAADSAAKESGSPTPNPSAAATATATKASLSPTATRAIPPKSATPDIAPVIDTVAPALSLVLRTGASDGAVTTDSGKGRTKATLNSDVTFEVDSATLTPRATEILDGIVSDWGGTPPDSVTAIGYTDSAGHTAAARTASATAASRTASPRTSSPRTTSRAAAQQTPPSAPPGPPVARSGRYAQPGYQVPGPGRPAGPVAGGYGGPRRGPYVGGPQDIPWVPGGAQGYSGAQPTVPPAPPAASYGARGYGTQPSLRSGRRPAPSSGSDTSAIKVVGWVLIIIIIIFLIRILTG